MKPTIALIKTPDPRGFSEDIMEGLEKALSAQGFETRIFEPTPENIQQVVEELNEFKPLFTFDINIDGVIFAENEKGEKVPLSDVVGNIHISWMLEDPMLHYTKLKPILKSNQFLYLTIDIDHGQWLAGMNKNVAFVPPAVNPSKIPPIQEKEFDIAFIGPVIDPIYFEQAWKERLDEHLYAFAIELGRLIYRNPDIPVRFASGFLTSQFTQEFQEAMIKFQQEKDEEFTALLAEIGGYAMQLRRWQIIDLIDDFQINILGQFQGETKDNIVVYEDINSIKDISTFLSKTKISLLSQPTFLPSGIGLTVFYSIASGTLTMVEEKLSTKSLFKNEEEIILYHPMNVIDLEAKIAYFLEDNPSQLNQIAKQGRDKIFKDHTIYQRAEMIGNIIQNILNQAQTNQSDNTENLN